MQQSNSKLLCVTKQHSLVWGSPALPITKKARAKGKSQKSITFSLCRFLDTTFSPRVLQYKWEAYCDTHRRVLKALPFLKAQSAESTSFPQGSEHLKYCNTNWRCIAISTWRFREIVVAVVSDILLKNMLWWCEPESAPM